jgi:GT2 family glycosyltransferase
MQLSIILVNFNTKNLLQQCLRSIYASKFLDEFEVIVVDNNSNDSSLDMVNNNFTQVKIIKNKKNVGFGRANNQGAKVAKGKWLLFLNSDTVVMPNALHLSLEAAKTLTQNRNKPIVLGCKLLNRDHSTQPSAGYFPTLRRVVAQMFFIDDLPLINRFLKPYQQTNVRFYEKKHEVDWVTGAFLLLPKTIFQDVQGFDESIFMYGEEVDLCYRLKQRGAEVFYMPEPVVFHYKGASSRDGFAAAVAGEYKGLSTLYQKYFPSKLSFLNASLKVGALLRILVFGIIDQKKVAAYKKALKTL